MALLLTLILVLAGVVVAPASGATALKVVSYRGYSVTVPASWPVYHVSAESTTCVRFNRHAVYLGQPGSVQDCPVNSAGRTEAILLQPSSSASAGVSGIDVGRLVQHSDGVEVTATWRSDPSTIRAALHLSSLSALEAAARGPARSRTVASARTDRGTRATAGSDPATPGSVFEGDGFDACSTPSESTMSNWGSASPYGAIGVYIGGVNMACSQPNLNSSWVDTESADGWHVIPIYVGEQAPSSSCSNCAAITSSQAAAEGSAAADDAIYEAQSIGIGSGNPIYYDMESYTRDSANTAPVLAFLQAWTEQLHADGYLSGIYSSDDSGIADLVSEVGTGYVEPDELWIANWNDEANTQDSVVPTSDWASNQRVHQYEGATDETYGGTTINVDNDYLDGATAAYGSGSTSTTKAVVAESVPGASASPTISGVPVLGQTLTESHATWSESPTSYSYQWYVCSSTGTDCGPIPGATSQTYTIASADVGQTVYAAETATNSVGTSPASDSAASAKIAVRASGYWSFTANGAVENSEYQLVWGSPASDGRDDFVGMAATRGRLGYWLVTKYASVYAYGNAATFPRISVANPVGGITRSPSAGYWLWTTHGNVYASKGTGFYGSAAARHVYDIAGMASLPNGNGYWLVTRIGTVFAYGGAPSRPKIAPAHPVIGIVAAPDHGYWLYTASGNVYNSRGAPYYGSPHVSDIASMLATPDGKGYWLITHTGKAYAYGDATKYLNPPPSGSSIVGLAG